MWGFVALKQKLVCWSLMASSPLSMGKVRKGHVRVHCEVWRVKCEGVKWRVCSAKCAVWSVKCEVESVTCEVWSVKCEV